MTCAHLKLNCNKTMTLLKFPMCITVSKHFKFLYYNLKNS